MCVCVCVCVCVYVCVCVFVCVFEFVCVIVHTCMIVLWARVRTSSGRAIFIITSTYMYTFAAIYICSKVKVYCRFELMQSRLLSSLPPRSELQVMFFFLTTQHMWSP